MPERTRGRAWPPPPRPTRRPREPWSWWTWAAFCQEGEWIGAPDRWPGRRAAGGGGRGAHRADDGGSAQPSGSAPAAAAGRARCGRCTGGRGLPGGDHAAHGLRLSGTGRRAGPADRLRQPASPDGLHPPVLGGARRGPRPAARRRHHQDGTIAAVWESRDREDQALAIDRSRRLGVRRRPGAAAGVGRHRARRPPRASGGATTRWASCGPRAPWTRSPSPTCRWTRSPVTWPSTSAAGQRIFRADDATVYALPAKHA